jgi:hypothetical protein
MRQLEKRFTGAERPLGEPCAKSCVTQKKTTADTAVAVSAVIP